MYSGAAICNSPPLHVKNATSVNTVKCLYQKWKRLNTHWIISNTYYCQSDSVFYTDLVNESVFIIDLINAYFISFIWLAWFGIDVIVSVYYSLLRHATTVVSFIYTFLLNYVVLRALWKIDVHLISPLVPRTNQYESMGLKFLAQWNNGSLWTHWHLTVNRCFPLTMNYTHTLRPNYQITPIKTVFMVKEIFVSICHVGLSSYNIPMAMNLFWWCVRPPNYYLV